MKYPKKRKKTDLCDFITTKRYKNVSYFIMTSLELKNVPSDLHQLQNSQLDSLQECLKKSVFKDVKIDWFKHFDS